MKKGKLATAIMLAMGFSSSASAINYVGTTDAGLLTDTLLNDDISVVGTPSLVGSAGLFSDGGNIGFDSGIVLTTGTIGSIGNVSNTSIQPIADLVGAPTFNGTSLAFNFTLPEGRDRVVFKYVFASHEYNEFVGQQFNDAFVFMLDGENLALVPGTADPVSINSINSSENSDYFSTDVEGLPNGVDGKTTVLTVEKSGLGEGQHEMVLAIADVSDESFDSFVFLSADSFSTELPPILIVPEASIIEESVEQITSDAMVIVTSTIARNVTNRVQNAFKASFTPLNVSQLNGFTGVSAGESGSPWGVWVSPSAGSFGSNLGTAYDGQTYSVAFGADKLISDRAVIGLSGVLEDTDSDYIGSNTGGIDSDGFSILAYAGYAITDSTILDAFAGLGRANHDIRRNGQSGDYDSDRWMFGLNLSKSFNVNDSLMLTAKAGLIKANEDVDSYLMDNQTRVDAETVKLTQGRLELEVSSQIGNAVPYAMIGLERDFENSAADDVNGDKTGGIVAGGFKYRVKDDVTFGIHGIASFDRDGENSSSISADLRYAF